MIGKVLDYAQSIGLYVLGLDFSPIKGPEGNIEYLAYLAKKEVPDTESFMIEETVGRAHAQPEQEIAKSCSKRNCVNNSNNLHKPWNFFMNERCGMSKNRSV